MIFNVQSAKTKVKWITGIKKHEKIAESSDQKPKLNTFQSQETVTEITNKLPRAKTPFDKNVAGQRSSILCFFKRLFGCVKQFPISQKLFQDNSSEI